MEGSPLLSDLPEEIIDHIFSYVVLTNQDAVHISLLSKQLFRVVQRRSTLAFHFEDIPTTRSAYQEPDAKYMRRYCEELNYIVSTLDRYHRQNIQLESFFLFPHMLLVTKDFHPIYSLCIKLAAKTSVRKLKIWMVNKKYKNVKYTLPQAVFRVKSLVELELMDCFLKPKKKVAWPNLKKLGIFGCKMSKEGFQYMCSSIENLDIDCHNFSNSIINIANLRNLKHLFTSLRPNQRLEMNASTLPKLESIKCIEGHIDLGNNAEYLNLTTLELFYCDGMDDGHFFSNFACKFPRLEKLCLSSCPIRRIDLSSPSLKEIELNCMIPQEMCFNLPNVVRFKCKGTGALNFPKLSFAGNSSGWSSDITLCEFKSGIDAPWFLGLNKFLAALNMSETSINVQIREKVGEVFNDEEHLTFANPIIPVQGIKEFSMSILRSWSGVPSVIFDCILLISHPQTITFTCCGDDYEIPQLLYKRLMPISDQDRRGVVGFEMSYVIENRTPAKSGKFKEWDEFLAVPKDAKDYIHISFHLKY